MPSRWYRYVEGQGLVELGTEQPAQPRIHVIEDTMRPLLNHADGKMYDSRSSYYRAVKAAGCEVVGSDVKSIKPKGPVAIGREGWKQAVKETIEKLSR